MNHVVIDSTNHVVRCFKTYQEAKCFIIVNNRFDWKIVSYHKADYKPTAKQQSAVRWTEHMLGIRFTGNINSGLSCSKFLSEYLEQAKNFYIELQKIITECEIDRKRAIEIAKVYNLDREVKWCMNSCGMTPQQALAEWDLL